MIYFIKFCYHPVFFIIHEGESNILIIFMTWEEIEHILFSKNKNQNKSAFYILISVPLYGEIYLFLITNIRIRIDCALIVGIKKAT